MMRRVWWVAVMGSVLIGCHHETPNRQSAKEYANALVNPVTQTKQEQERHARAFESKGLKPVSGVGKLLEIDQDLGIGTLEIDGKPVRFWWNNRVYKASVREQAWKDPETRMTEVPFQVEVGDTIYFKGFQSRDEIFFTNAAAVKK